MLNVQAQESTVVCSDHTSAQASMSLQFRSSTSSFFNEMVDSKGHTREELINIEHWLSAQSLASLEQLNQHAHQHFIEQGITFNVYGEAAGTERCIPYDLIPRVIRQKQWNVIAKGCHQRVHALNAFLDDIYHDHHIIKAGLVPAQQVLQHEAYQPWMMNVKLKGKIYSHISGIDIIRDDAGEFFVLEDNLRTPSGVSYMIESRKISQRIMPDLCGQYPLQGIEQYPALLRETLSENAHVDNPLIVVLTPGRFNSAYFEHAFLAREMGVPLVTNQDLYVDADTVFVKTIRGPKQVDVIYRRLDDAYLDPLAFKPDSALGVPGLMAAYRQNKVVIANAPGTGVADDKSIYPYVDDMIRFYLDEEPILSNVPTYQCRHPDDLKYVLANLPQLVVKEAQGSGGYGMLIGPKATKAELTEFESRLKDRPQDYIAQPTLALSVSPTLTETGIAERHIDLRPFVLSSPSATRIVPGGLTRVALKEGSLVVNSSQGGGIKDTWVIDDEANHTIAV